MTIQELTGLLIEQRKPIDYKGKELSIDVCSTPDNMVFNWGDKQFTLHPDWDKPDALYALKDLLEDAINKLIAV